MRRSIALAEGADPEGFRRAVRLLVAEGVPPQGVAWTAGEMPTLFGETELADAPPLALPRMVGDLAGLVACHRDGERHALLYRLIWRVLHGERELLQRVSDPLVHRLAMMAKAVRRDVHKMHAFVRFRAVAGPEGEHFVAWFEPEHFIVARAAPFFVDRFRSMRWSILTPVGALHFDGTGVAIGPPAERRVAPGMDGFEESWRGYYESVFNPARVNPAMMQAEMPKRYWRNLPEASLIPGLVRSAAARVEEMTERAAMPSARRNPEKAVAAMSDQEPRTLDALNGLIAASAPMVTGGTRAVLGEGPLGADIAFVGEQPGDQEDIEGRPFVGPAGALLNRALQEVGIDRTKVYVTNAVKHFKFEQRGKRRLHQSPTAGEVKHYRWWLTRELDFVAPKLVVALGATAVLALTGKALPVTRNRGAAELDGHRGFITVHPSYLLRIPDRSARDAAHEQFLDDLRAVRALSA